jgi:hypothetical protein
MPTELHTGQIVHFGYTPNPPHAAALHARMQPLFGAAHDLLAADDDDGDRYNYRPLVACLMAAGLKKWLVLDGDSIRLNTYDQGDTRTCHANANGMRLALERAVAIVTAGIPEDFTAMPAPGVLASFCEEIDGSLGGDFGGSGSGEVEGLEKFGAAYELTIGSYDLSAGNAAGQDIAAWREQTISFLKKNGAPQEIRAFAKNHLSAAHLRIDTVSQAWAAIGQGHSLLVCSNRAYNAKRNEEGIIHTTGSNWAHAMCVSSRRTSPKYGRLYLVHQSWFPTWTTGPYWLDQPLGSFWITEDDLAIMLICRWSWRNTIRDSWISTGAQGFVRRADRLPDYVAAA